MVHLHFRLPDESGDALFWTISQWYWRSRGHNSIKPRSGLMDSWYLIDSKKKLLLEHYLSVELSTLRFHLDEKNRKKSFIKNNGTFLSKNCRTKDISEFVSPILNGKKLQRKGPY